MSSNLPPDDDGKRSIALFWHPSGNFTTVSFLPASHNQHQRDAWKPSEGYERVSEWLDVKFSMLPEHALAAQALDRLKLAEAEAMKKLLNVQIERERILAREYAPPQLVSYEPPPYVANPPPLPLAAPYCEPTADSTEDIAF